MRPLRVSNRMADRDKILKYFRASGDEDLAAQLLDLAERANKTNKFKVSAFLDPPWAQCGRDSCC